MTQNDFSKIDVLDFLESLNMRNVRDGLDEVIFSCPFTENHKNNDNNPSSSMSKTNKLIFCQGCKEGHNPITFLAKIEDISRVLAERYITERYGGKNYDGISLSQLFQNKLGKPIKEIVEENTGVSTPKNKVIPWAYASERILDLWNYPDAFDYLESRGLESDVIRFFDIGYDKQSDRIVIPVCDEDGQLLGFKGRTFKEDAPLPRYLVVGDRTGNTWGFGTVNVQDEIFNFHNLSRREPVVIVEGEFDAMKIHQYGWENVCALYGSTFTQVQKEKLISVSNEFILFLDSDAAGDKCKEKIINQLGPSCIIRVVENHEGDPSDMTKEECISLIENAQSPHKYKLMQKEKA